MSDSLHISFGKVWIASSPRRDYPTSQETAKIRLGVNYLGAE